jgi:GAF domain-containing protein/two-component sensor histidine kinase
MDTTTVASTPVRAWELLADLAAYGQEHSASPQELAQQIVELIQQHLACPWGLIVIGPAAGDAVIANWGVDADLQRRLLDRDQSSLPDNTAELRLRHDDEPAGVLFLGFAETPLVAEGFLLALRNQIEMLITMQRRSFEQQRRARELYVIFENATTLNSSAPLDSLLARAVENTALALGTDFCTVHLIDQSNAALLVEAAAYGGESEGGVGSVFQLRALPALARVLVSQEPLIHEGAPLDAAAPLPALRARSLLLQPLRIREQAIGAVAMGYHDRSHRFTRGEITIAQTLAAQIAVAIANTWLAAAEQRRTAELDTIRQIGGRLGSELAFDDILSAIIDGARKLAPFAAALITLHDPHEQVLRTMTAPGLAADDRRPGYSFADGLTGWVARHRRVLLLRTMQQAPVRPLLTGVADGSPVRSYLGLPLLIGDQLVGTLELFSTAEAGFSAVDERALAIVASQASQAISNTLRYEQADDHLRSRLQQLKALQRISRELTATLYLHNILGFTLNEALRATRATYGYIALRGYTAQHEGYEIDQEEALGVTPSPQIFITLREVEEDGPVRIVAAAGYAEAEQHRLLNHDIGEGATSAERVMLSGEPLVIDELNHDDRPLSAGAPVASVLVVPIYYEAQIIGVVNLHSATPHIFDRDALDFSRAVADQIALAIGNEERFFEQRRQRDLLQQRAGTLSEVLRIGQELRADRSLSDVLEQIAFSVIETARFRAVAFYLVNDELQLAEFAAAAGLPLDEIERRRETTFSTMRIDDLLHRQFRIGRCFFVPGATMREIAPGLDLIAGEREIVQNEAEWQPDDALLVPLYSTRARLIGIMITDEPFDRQRPTRRAVEPIEVFADQAAIAIENANLFNEARSQTEQMTALYRVSAAANVSLDLDELLERFYEAIVAYMGVPSFFYVASYNQQRGQIRFELFRNDHGIHTARHKTSIPKSGLTGWVIDNSAIFHSPDLQADAVAGALPVESLVMNEPVRTWLGIPLLIQNTVIGVLSVQSLRVGAFSERDIRFLSTLANQLAIALQNAQLFTERERRISELDVINRIGHITSSTLNLEQMLGQVYDCLADFLSVDAFFAFVYHSDRNEIVNALLVDEGRRSYEVRHTPPAEGGLVYWLVNNRQALLFGDLNAEAEQYGIDLSSFGNEERATAACLAVPLLVGEGEVVGVLSVQSYTPNLYSDRELAFLTTVASQVALGVQNARLFGDRERQIVELDALGRIGRVTGSTLELRPMVEGLNMVLREVLDADGVSLTLLDRERAMLHLLNTYRNRMVLDREQPVAEIAEQTLAYGIMRSNRPLRVGTIDDRMAAALDLSGLLEGHGAPGGSYLGIPVFSYDGTPIGALAVISRRTDAFHPRDEAFMVNIGAQVSLGIQNARLFAEAQGSATAFERKVGELSTILRAAQVLSSSLRPSEVLDSLIEAVRNQLLVNSVALWTITGDDMLRPAAMLGIPTEVSSTLRVPVGRGLTGRVAASGRPLVVYDVEDDGGSLYPTFNRQHNYTSFMGVPVIYQGHTIGVLSVMTTRERQFSEDEVTLLAGLADQAAIALENARLFAEREKRINELTTLNNISRAVNATLELEELLDALYHGISEVFSSDQSFIALYDAETQRISFPIFQNRGELVAEPDTPIGEAGDAPLSSRVITTRQPLLLRTQADVDAIAPEPEPGDRQIASWLGVPIIQGEEVFGVIAVQSFEPNAYDEDGQRFLVTVANQAAIALNNVRLFTSEQNRRRAADTLREVAQTLTGVLELNEILALILDQLARVVPYDTASLMLREGDILRITASRGFDEPVRTQVERLSFPYYDDPLLDEVVRARRPVVIHDVRGGNHPVGNAPNDGTDHIRGWIGAPLLLNDEVIGVLNIDSRTVGAYGEEDAQLAFALASQAAQAIRNARLFEEVRRFNAELEQRVEERTAALADANTQLSAEKERLQAVHNITLELTASLELETTLNKALGLAATAVGARRGSIMLREQNDNRLICRALLGSDGQVHTQTIAIAFDTGVSLAGWVMRHHEPICIADVRQDPRWLREEGRADEVRSVIAAPLMTQDGPLGVIMLSSPRINYFSQDQVQLLATIANEVAIVIHNATLYSVINEIALERGELWAQQREENSKNQAILQSLGEGVIVLDEQGNVALFNPAAEQMLDIPATFVLGKRIGELITYSSLQMTSSRAHMFVDGVDQGLRVLNDRHANHNRMLELPAPDQVIALNFAQWLGPRGDRYGSVIVLRDVTREIDADRTKREFVSNVSHELRTPLTAIKGYVDLLLLGGAGHLDAEQTSYLQVVKNNTRRLMDLIADLLEIGRLDDNRVQLHFERVHIGDILRDVLQSLRVEVERKAMTIEVAVAEDVTPVMADPKRLTQVVTNLVSNAVKYTHREGRIAIAAFTNPAGLMQVNVQDNGVGISAEDQKKLGRRFVRFDNELRDEAGGTGLGLSIAWSLIELHGGQMWVESEPGKGSTFSFVIPASQPDRDGNGERDLPQ